MEFQNSGVQYLAIYLLLLQVLKKKNEYLNIGEAYTFIRIKSDSNLLFANPECVTFAPVTNSAHLSLLRGNFCR